MRIVSVRPCSKRRVRAVSYVAVKVPRVLYQASCMAIWMYASGERRAGRDSDISESRIWDGKEKRGRRTFVLDPVATIVSEPVDVVVRVSEKCLSDSFDPCDLCL